ncbi:MAG: mannose-6-phosphate isomerase, class I [Vicinamibacteria bacterium]|nr:mannose-6-phosphate isomerase, class I [Vicinamibacteria bacterium]
MDPLFRLRGTVQHYAWGGHDLIPGLLGVDNADGKPYAEMWIGAHPRAPSLVVSHDPPEPFDALIARNPRTILGDEASARFHGRLPYLLKVLDVRGMLSIQVHPDKRQAEEGFARENASGVALDAVDRNYRDDNHKPEAHVALTDFWMLHGFRHVEEIARLPHDVPELRVLMSDFTRRSADATRANERDSLLKSLYATVMELPQAKVDDVLNPLLARLRGLGSIDKDTPDYWALRAARELPLPDGHVDRGIFSIYFLNLLRLRPGQGTHQPAGLPHAYLEGACVEIMANSDNVLRGGLTPKHVDVPELLRVLKFTGGKPEILAGEAITPAEKIYRTPSREFQLGVITVSRETSYSGLTSGGPDALIVMKGGVRVSAKGFSLEVGRGGILLVPYGVMYGVDALAEYGVVYRAGVPA